MGKMRVLQLATSLLGGAGIATNRFHQSLLASGVHSELLSRDLSENYDSQTRKLRVSASRKFMSSLNTLIQTELVQKSNFLVTPNSVETLEINREILKDYDLIHIHAFYNLLSMKSFSSLSKSNIPIVLTMHDQRLFTGGCHYSLGCSNYQNMCTKCPQVNYWARSVVLNSQQNTRRVINDCSKLHLIAPSSWLASESKKSSILKDRVVSVIPNPVPQVFFDAFTNRIENQVFRIGFSSINLDNPYKGLPVLIKALNLVSARNYLPAFEFYVFGKGQIPGLLESIPVKQKLLASDREIANELAKVDLLVIPSLQDNLPSVLTEALAAGCRVVCSRTGGISEIADIMNMPTFEVGDHIKLAELIESEILSRSKMTNSQLQLRYAFSPRVVADQAIEVYERALS
jgi:glycosyltransferase involved in cell wall biosynthesis